MLTYELMPLDEAEIESQMSQFEPFAAQTRNNKQHMRELIRQLIQHNLRVIERYYSKIRLERLAVLVGVSLQRAEQEVCDMVVNKGVMAKINRLEGIVVFNYKLQQTNDKLSSWNADVRTTLDKIEATCHLISRDSMTQ